MNPPLPSNTITQESEFILRRLQESFPDLVLGLPILFALGVLFLVLFYRQQESLGNLLKTLFVPPKLVLWATVVWGIWLLVYLGLTVIAVLARWTVEPMTALYGLLPLIIYPAILGVLGMLVLCLRHPGNFVALLVVVGISVVYFVFALLFKPTLSWWVVLMPVLLVGFIYIGMMYQRDAQTVHPLWAAFLGFLRGSVYLILGFVFLLPGCQTYDTSETHSKVLVLFDVSGSMNLVDDLPKPGQDPKTLPTRQAKVMNLLTALTPPDSRTGLTWMERLQQKSPVTAYRFGAVLDDFNLEQFIGKPDAEHKQITATRKWAVEEMEKWLKPDRSKLEVPREIGGRKLTEKEHQELTLKLSALYDELLTGTNISGAALQAVLKEAGHMIQAVIIFSDGQNNLGSADTFNELQLRAANLKRPIHIITVGVGRYRQPVSIRIDELVAPQQARPDDKFPVRVPVHGDGLLDKDFTVSLDITRLVKKGDKYETIPGFKKTLTKQGKFKGTGANPQDEVEFEIDVRELAGIDPKDESKDDLIEGMWEFRARVPRDPAEAFPEAEHISKRPARVLVQKRKLRVLLFAGAANRDYQFVRTLFYREVLEKRMEMSIYLQTAGEKDVDQDVEGERLLSRFPDRRGPGDPKDKHMSLDEYDVIIAFDPNWAKLETETLKEIKKWVSGPSAGGLVLVADPVNSYQLARPGGVDLSPILTILPVTLKDSRLHGLGVGHDPGRPYTLNFPDPDKANLVDFLRVDEDADLSVPQIWDKFFWGGLKPEGSKDAIPRRGFHNYYPVDKVKPGAIVLATFAGPTSARLEDGKEMPYIVWMPYGAGRTVYIGSGETWRLRTYKETYHQRFWIKLARFAGGGNLSKVSRYGQILMKSRDSTGSVAFEAQVLDENFKPLPRDSRPVVEVVRPKDFDEKADKETPAKFELKAKSTQGEWNGWFSGVFKVRTPGDYTIKIPIPGTSQYLSHDITIYRPDPELDNLRPNHAFLYQLATEARPLLKKIKAENIKRQLEKVLVPPAAEEGKDPAAEVKEQVRLYFPLEYSHLIPDCLEVVPPEKISTKGRLMDLWDQGFTLFEPVSVYWVLLIVPAVVGLICAALVAAVRQWLFAAVLAALSALVPLAVWFIELQRDPSSWEWIVLPINMSFVLAVVVGLLALEWLTRKLLRLA